MKHKWWSVKEKLEGINPFDIGIKDFRPNIPKHFSGDKSL